MSKRRRQHRSSSGGQARTVRFYILGTALTLAVVGVVILIAATAGGGSEAPSGPVVTPAARPAGVAQNGNVYGDPNASVTISEYLDYQCPFCMLAAVQILPEIERRYVETGIAKLEIHPIAIIGEESIQAAAAAECAKEQGAFLEYHDALLANQGGENVGAFSDSRLKEIASAIGLDTEGFGACLDGGAYRTTVGDNTRAAADLGIRSTPTFLVNGVRVETGVEPIAAAVEAAADGG